MDANISLYISVTLIGALLLIPASYFLESEFVGVFGWIGGSYIGWFLATSLLGC